MLNPEKIPSVPRDGYGRPLIVPVGGGKPVPHTRVTTFVDCIEDTTQIEKWKMYMVLRGATLAPGIVHAARGLDPYDPDPDKAKANKRTLTDLAYKSLDAAGGNDRTEKGTELHGMSEVIDTGGLVPFTVEQDKKDIAEYMLLTSDLTILDVEQFVVIPALQAGGTLDRRVHYSGPGPDGEHIEGNFILDIKTGSSVELGAVKISGQIAAYANGQVYDFTQYPVDIDDKAAIKEWRKIEYPAIPAAYSPLDVRKDWGIVLHLPSGKGAGKLYWADLALGWRVALQCQQIRELRKLKNKAIRPFMCDSVTGEGN